MNELFLQSQHFQVFQVLIVDIQMKFHVKLFLRVKVKYVFDLEMDFDLLLVKVKEWRVSEWKVHFHFH